MTALRQRMLEDMKLHGLSERTQESYLGSVKALTRYYNRSPDQLTEEEIRQFFLYLVTKRKVAESKVRIYLCGIKFFYEKTLGRTWTILNIVRPRKVTKLPVVLSQKEVRRILLHVRNGVVRMALIMIYTCGLRLTECTNLQIADIDRERMRVRVRNGKGAKERYVSLPERILVLLRAYYRKRRPDRWLFPSKDNTKGIAGSTLQRAFKSALRASGVDKDATIHTLRHSYATHLLEMGVELRVIQDLLGHRDPASTTVYTHLTDKKMSGVQARIDSLMSHL